MQIIKTILTPTLISKSKHYFITNGRSDFLTKRDDSLCCRYLIAQKINKELKKSDFIPENGVFNEGELRRSSSHSGNQLFIAIDKKKVAVDCEKIKKSPTKYYLDRCKYECMVKYLDLELDNIEKVNLNNYSIDIAMKIENGYVFAHTQSR